jgi:hypothetical protein
MDSNKKTLVLTRQELFPECKHKEIIDIKLSDFSKVYVTDKIIINAFKIIFYDYINNQIKILKNTNFDLFSGEKLSDEFIFDIYIPELKEENHCVDCCCAKSWEALGVTTYTGKSIPEHIEELVKENKNLKEKIRKIEKNRRQKNKKNIISHQKECQKRLKYD